MDHAQALHVEFGRERWRVKRADPECNNCAGVAEDGMLKAIGKLREVLVGGNQREPPFARLREDQPEPYSDVHIASALNQFLSPKGFKRDLLHRKVFDFRKHSTVETTE